MKWGVEFFVVGGGRGVTTFENFINFFTEGFIFIIRKRSGGIH